MSDLHLVYQHWFITILLVVFGGGSVFNGIAGIVRAWRRPETTKAGDQERLA